MRKRGYSEIIEKLRSTALDSNNGLNERDRDFALSLCSSFDRFGELTPKQLPWVDTLLERAEQGSTTGTMKPKPVVHSTLNIGGMSELFVLFDKARAKDIQKPKIRIDVDGKGYSLWVGKDLDWIQISTRNEDWGQNRWLGAFAQNGDMRVSQKETIPEGVIKFLQEFNLNPSTSIGAMGKRMKWCCFCGRELTTTDSLFYGYGPICAETFGLEWGEAQTHIAEQNMDEIGKFVQQEMQK